MDIVEVQDTNEFLIMEINSSVCMKKFSQRCENGKMIEKQIFSKAMDKMFE